jgi:hypothetical protein
MSFRCRPSSTGGSRASPAAKAPLEPLYVRLLVEPLRVTASVSTSRAPHQPVMVKIKDAVEPGFAPDDYVEDTDLDKLFM